MENQSPSVKRPQYHQSQLHVFLKCGLQYEYRYVRGIKTPSRYYHVVGRAVDTGTNANFTNKIQTEKALPVSDVLDIVSTDFDKESVDAEWMGESPDKQKDIAIECAKVHHEQIAPLIQPEKVQEPFEIDTDAGYKLGGTMDLTTKDGWIRDTKTARAKGGYAVHKSMQAAMYDFAYEVKFGKKANGFAYDAVIKPTKTKPASTEIISARVTDSDRQWLFKTIDAVHRAIQAGVFLPAPEGSWYCSEKWCSYFNVCKGKKN